MNSSSPYSRIIFFLFTLTAVILLLYPSLNYQPFLSQGDHGRDLYAFQKTLEGQKPYQDYWWVYGPLMPQYYAHIEKFFGVSLSSVLIGKNILLLTASAIFFWILSFAVELPLAFLGTLWFAQFNPDFFFTYNHLGGIVCLLFSILCIFRYAKDPAPKYIWLGLISLFILSLIKINFGFSSLIAFCASAYFIDRYRHPAIGNQNRNFYLASLIIIILFSLSIYFVLIFGLSTPEIRQCFPYLKGDEPYNSGPFWQSLFSTIKYLFSLTFTNMNLNLWNRIFGLICLFSLAQCCLLVFSRSIAPNIRKSYITFFTILSTYYILNLHEFVVSGVLYRSFWSKPEGTLFIFIALSFAMHALQKTWRNLIYILISLFLMLDFHSFMNNTSLIKNPDQYLNFDKGRIYVGNHPNWIRTVTSATSFLNDNLSQNELFFALPYDPIYYYLTGKNSPTRQLIFFDHIRIPPEQEKKIIIELEKKHVNWIVLSNRYNSGEQGLGKLGETYCPLIGRYITDHFKTVATIGDWENHPGWAWNHGVKILKRK